MKKVTFIFVVYKSINTLCKRSILTHTFPSSSQDIGRKQDFFCSLGLNILCSCKLEPTTPLTAMELWLLTLAKRPPRQSTTQKDVPAATCSKYQIFIICAAKTNTPSRYFIITPPSSVSAETDLILNTSHIMTEPMLTWCKAQLYAPWTILLKILLLFFKKTASVLRSWFRNEVFQHHSYLLLSYLSPQHLNVKCLL